MSATYCTGRAIAAADYIVCFIMCGIQKRDTQSWLGQVSVKLSFQKPITSSKTWRRFQGCLSAPRARRNRRSRAIGQIVNHSGSSELGHQRRRDFRCVHVHVVASSLSVVKSHTQHILEQPWQNPWYRRSTGILLSCMDNQTGALHDMPLQTEHCTDMMVTAIGFCFQLRWSW
jgi:hypothetical protein